MSGAGGEKNKMKSNLKRIVPKVQEKSSEGSLTQQKTMDASEMKNSAPPMEGKSSPFQRSSRMKRTPPSTPPISAKNAEEMAKKAEQEEAPELSMKGALTIEVEEIRESPVISRVLAGGSIGSPEEKDMEVARRRVDEELRRMKDILKKMKLATGRQRNISMDIKDGLYELEESVEVIESLRGFWGVALQRLIRLQERSRTPGILAHAGTQVSSLSIPTDINDKELVVINPGEGRTEETLATSEWTEVRPRKALKPQKTKDHQAAESLDENKQCLRPKAKRRKRNKKKKPPKPRLDALLIKPAEGKSYAEVLGEIREKVKPEDTETEVRCIRQTRSGDILVELGRNTKDKAAFETVICSILQESATVRQLEPKVSVEIRDLDSLSSEEEVTEAIRQQLGEHAGDLRVHLTKANNRGLKVAIVQLSVRGANELMKDGYIKIGWVRCRVKRRTIVPKCFRCLGYGHVSGACKGPDRSNLCYRCGEAGHVSKTCTAKGNCMLCADRKLAPDACQHLPGSGSCKVFREALEEAKRSVA